MCRVRPGKYMVAGVALRGRPFAYQQQGLKVI